MITSAQTQTSGLKAEYNLGYIWLISVVAALGGLLFGYDWVVIGGAKQFFENYFNLQSIAQSLGQFWILRLVGLGSTTGVSGFANSCALIGCLVGALVAGALSDKFGRKRLLIASAFLFAITSIGNG